MQFTPYFEKPTQKPPYTVQIRVVWSGSCSQEHIDSINHGWFFPTKDMMLKVHLPLTPIQNMNLSKTNEQEDYKIVSIQMASHPHTAHQGTQQSRLNHCPPTSTAAHT